MTRIGRRPWLKWSLRALLALAACEATLALGARVIEQRGVPGERAIPDGCVLCIGDSNTQGVGAPPGRSYPDQLQELLRAAGDPRAVVNLGVAGFGSRQVIDRLEDALAEGKPSCVLYLAGNNDLAKSPSLLALGSGEEAGGAAARLDAALSCLRTWRMARAAWSVATGDLGHHELGGAETRRLPPPQAVHSTQRDVEYARAKEAGTTAIAEWVEHYWQNEEPHWTRIAWDDLRASPDFERLRPYFRQPLAVFEWELAALENGRWGAPPGPIANPAENHSFIVAARALAAWSAGDLDAMRAELERPEEREWVRTAGPWAAVHFELHRGFAQLLAREWRQAEATLSAALARTKTLSPSLARPSLEGGAALAHLFADAGGTAASDATSAPSYVHDPAAWQWSYWSPDQPNGREWMAVAEIAEGTRAGRDSEAFRKAWWRARDRFEQPRTLPLRWLFDHPDATFEQIRAELPLEPPRTTWWGIRRFLFRNLDADEFRRVSAAQHERLAALARRDSFAVVVLGYVSENYPGFNAVQRELAATRGWPLADVHSRYTRAELEADDRKRYFFGDRAHPNEAGYGLMAREAFDVLQKLRSGSSQ